MDTRMDYQTDPVRLSRATVALQGPLEIEQLADEIVRQVHTVLEGARCALLLPKGDEEHLKVRTAYGGAPGSREPDHLELEVPLSGSAVGQAFEDQQVVLAHDFPSGRNAIPAEQDTWKGPVVACVPLVWEERSTGVLTLELDGRHRRDVDQAIELIAPLVSHAAAALDRAVRYEDTRHYAESLESANARLLQLDKVRQDLLSTMGHELRTPLMAIEGYAHMLLTHPSSDLTREQEDFVEGIRESGRRQLVIITDMLDYSRMEAGQLELDVRAYDLQDVLRRVLQTIRPMAISKAQTLTDELPSYVPMVRADGRRLYQILLNLVGNAVKFTPPGGRITVAAQEVLPGEIQVTVTDTGIGIPEEEQQLIFGRFYRGRAPEDEGLPGTGLGLAISKHLVELHGGRIWVESKPGEGSTFGFTVPTFFSTPQPRPTHLLLTSRAAERDRYLDSLCQLVGDRLAAGYRLEFIGPSEIGTALAESCLAAGISFQALVDRHQVAMLHDRTLYQSGQFVDSQRLMDGVFGFYRQSVHEGHKGVCLIVDMTWLYAGERRLSHVLGYEAQLEQALSRMRGPLTIACHYNLDDLADDASRELRLMHPAREM